MANSFKQSRDQALALIKDIETEIKKLDNQLISTAKKLNTTLKSGGNNNIASQLQQVNKQMQQFNALSNKQTQSVSKLGNAKKKLNSLSLIEKDTRQKSLRALKLQATANNKLASSYERLIAQKKRIQYNTE